VLRRVLAGSSNSRFTAARFVAGAGAGSPNPPRTGLDPDDDDRDLESERWERAAKIRLSAAKHRKKQPEECKKVLADYFRSRGIEHVPPYASVLPAGTLLFRKAKRTRYPAMVLPFLDHDGKFRGVMATYLTKDSSANVRRANGKSVRLSFGLIKGGFIPLGHAYKADAPLVLTEGVEDALSIEAITGLCAIAAGNANLKAVNLPPCAELIIAGDNDPSGTGRKAAEEAAAIFANTPRKVRIAIPQRHKDWNDAWRDLDVDVAKLKQAILNAPVVNPDPGQLVLSMGDILDLAVPPREYLLKPWLATDSLNMIHAWRGSGKTRFMMACGYAIALKKPFLGWTVERAARVLYVDGELPTILLQKRLRELGPPMEEFRILSYDHLLRMGVARPDLGTPAGRTFLDKLIADGKIDVIILDALTSLFRSGEENAEESWTAVQDWMMQHRLSGRTIILVHHEGKSGTQRGTSKREDVLDTVLRLKARDDLAGEDDSCFELTFMKSREFHGADKAPRILRLRHASDTGWGEWTSEEHQTESEKRDDEIAERLAAGKTHKEIAKEFGVGRSRVSQIAAALRASKRNVAAAEEEEEEEELEPGWKG
jgi:putative DNA primase/helicase